MARIVLIHWHPREAEERAAPLRKAGHRVACHSDQYGPSLRAYRADPPDLFVIDLARLPSQGRAVGVALRQQKDTRHVPLVFIEGDPAKTDRVRSLLPDAAYTDWAHARGVVTAALRRRPRDPTVPGTMDDYSGTPLPRKLGIGAEAVVALSGAPEGFEKILGALPGTARLKRDLRGGADVILLFTRTRAELRRRFPAAARALADRGKLWIAWPKKTSELAADLSQSEVRAHGLAHGFVDFKIAALDATWSGLCFSRRRRG
jgi:CheY-like chemotaxis protein